MDQRQELRECEDLANELSQRIRSLRAELGDKPLVEGSSFGQRLRLLRARKGWSQVMLAEQSGLSSNGINKLEQDQTSRPRATTVHRLATALDVDPIELTGGA